VDFAQDTPYETHFTRASVAPQAMVSPEIVLMDQLLAAQEQTDRMKTLADDVAVAFFHRPVVLHIQLKNLTSHPRRNAHDVGARRRIVRARVSFGDSPNVECDDHRPGDDDQTDNLADELVSLEVDVR